MHLSDKGPSSFDAFLLSASTAADDQRMHKKGTHKVQQAKDTSQAAYLNVLRDHIRKTLVGVAMP